jgi:hypothetical protein
VALFRRSGVGSADGREGAEVDAEADTEVDTRADAAAPIALRRRHPQRVTSSIASRTIDPLIFDSPAVRSMNVIGTSAMLRPTSWARMSISI